MKQWINEVIKLQLEYSSKNTPEMERRGQLIRNKIPQEIITHGVKLRSVLGSVGEDATAEGSDATGRKTFVPWVRWYSVGHSPSAQQGWYIVYLFHPNGEGVSLCLSHGSTEMQNGSYVSRSDAEVDSLMTWAAGIVGSEFIGDVNVKRGLSLGGKDLAQAYERTTVFSKFYPRGSVPTDQKLIDDIARFCVPLRKLYEAQDRRLTPGSRNPEASDAEVEIEKIAAPLRTTGQARGLTAGERKLVELRAMYLAKKWLREQGFTFEDVSAREACDFRAKRNGQDFIIEVKGTTGNLSNVLLTRNEVALHRQSYPLNALLVVWGIELIKSEIPNADGGELAVFSPWQLMDDRLTPLCFEYRLET